MYIQPLSAYSRSNQQNANNANLVRPQTVAVANAVKNNPVQSPAVKSPDTLYQDTVRLSPQARIETDITPMPMPTPGLPMPSLRDNVQNYVEFTQAKMKYQVVSDMTNIVTGTSDGMSASTMRYLNQHDEVRAATVQQLAYEQQVNTMQVYAASSANAHDNNPQQINEWA